MRGATVRVNKQTQTETMAPLVKCCAVTSADGSRARRGPAKKIEEIFKENNYIVFYRYLAKIFI